MNGGGSVDMTNQQRRQNYLNRREDIAVAIVDDAHSYLYRPRQVILRGDPERRAEAGAVLGLEFSARVQPTIFDVPSGGQGRSGSPPLQPGRLLRLGIDPSLQVERRYVPVGLDAREAITRLKGQGFDSSLNHIFCGEQYWAGEPAALPEPVSARDLPDVDDDPKLGAGVKVAILDTGIDRAANRHARLRGHTVVTADDIDHLDGEPNGYLDHEAGHGTFVAGIIMRHAPGASFLSYAVLDPAGVGHETVIADAITEAANEGCQIINMSLGGYTWNDEAPGALQDAIEQLRHKDVVVVAAAGNAFDEAPGQRPFWPAAFSETFPWVIAVAAGNSATNLAPFSNRGRWVTCRTNGEDVVSTYVRGTWDPDDGGAKHFEGYARWSGTSFAAPRVAAAIAAKTSPATHVTARQARDQVVPQGQRTIMPVDGGGVFIP